VNARGAVGRRLAGVAFLLVPVLLVWLSIAVYLDAVALRYALEVTGGVDGLAVTHLDVAGARPDLRVCHSYEIDGERVGRLESGPPDLDRQAALTRRLLAARPVYAPLGNAVETIEDALGAPVVLRSHGPASTDKRSDHFRTPIDLSLR
ncbi:adenylosuccinate synthetase, partial [Actinomadura luteofluorescens]